MLLSCHKFVCAALLLPNVGIYIRVSTRQALQNFIKVRQMVKIFSGYSSHFLSKFSFLERKENRLKM